MGGIVSYHQKILAKASLLAAVAEARKQGKTIVQCHGCFDIVHPGHVRYLQFARQHGDVLIVSITGDEAIDKGTERPYIPQELRAENLAALSLVDYVYIDPHHTATDILGAVAPDAYIKGEEYERSQDPNFLNERRIVESQGGRVIFSSGDVVFSSSEIIRRLGRETDIEARRLRYLCQRHHIHLPILRDIIKKFSQQKVLVVGDVVVDRYVSCDPIDIAHESPMMSLKELGEQTYIGGAGIVARHLSKLGAQATLLTNLGGDRLSTVVEGVLKQEDVESLSVNTRGGLVVKTRFLVEETKLFKVEKTDIRPLDSQTVTRARDLILDRAQELDAVIFCDFGYGMVTEGLLREVLKPLRRTVRILSADVSGSRGNLLGYMNVDLLCPTEREARATLHNFDQSLSVVAWQLINSTQARHLITTLGRRGLVAFDRQSQDPKTPEWSGRLRGEYIQSLNGQAADNLGCGDALLAGSTLALAGGGSFLHAAYLGNAMAALEAREIGNQPISATRLCRFLDERLELQE